MPRPTLFPQYNSGEQLLLDSTIKVLFSRYLGQEAVIWHAGRYQRVKPSRLRRIVYVNHKWSVGMEVIVTIIDEFNETNRRVDLLAKIVSIEHSRPEVLVTENHPVWHGCRLKDRHYRYIKPVEDG